MPLPILQTKFYAPRRPLHANLVGRPRLTKKLNAGLAGKVTVLSAPAGFGKSTLLSEWIEHLRAQRAPAIDDLRNEAADGSPPGNQKSKFVNIAWLMLDHDDNDPVRFLTYLIVGLQKFATTMGETAMALLQAPGGFPGAQAPKTILTALINDLSLLAGADSPAPDSDGATPIYVLVLEDYHVITAQPVHVALTYLIDHLPAHMHVIITTRADPPLPLARWRVRDQLSEIRVDDLRFTPDETAAFLNDRMGLQLATDEVMTVGARTEGWIAGLQLVALSMQGRDDKAGFLQTFSGDHRYILSYLTEEVFNQQPSVIQDFLLRTSILDRLCGPLCDILLTNEDLRLTNDGIDEGVRQSEIVIRQFASAAILERLYRANLFLMPLDDEGHWYRYHQLFAEVLQHRLRQNQPDLLPTLHRRASAWYAQNELLADAIRHALLASDFARAAELVEQIWPMTWNQGALATLLNWVHALPHAALMARPDLAVS